MSGFLSIPGSCGCNGRGTSPYLTMGPPSATGFRQSGLGHHGGTEMAVLSDYSGGSQLAGLRGLGDLTTLSTDFANGDWAAVFADLLPYLAIAGGAYLIYRFVFKKKGGSGSGRRARMAQARAKAEYELAKARVGE